MPVRCLIIDDEAPARDELRFLLSRIDDAETVGEADSVRAGLERIDALAPDLVFLDIQMPGGSGFDLVSALADRPVRPLVVFATAYDQYAIDAFAANALDYILKPFEESRVRASIDRARERLSQPPDRRDDQLPRMLAALQTLPAFARIAVEHAGRLRLVDPDAVVFLSAEDRTTVLHTRDEALTVHGDPSLDAMNERLAGKPFYRVHRSYLVHLTRIRHFAPWQSGRYEIVMDDDDGTRLPVSRSRVKGFKAALGL